MSFWEGVKAAWKVLPRIGATDPYTRILQLEDRLDEERERRREAEAEVEHLQGQLATREALVPDDTVYWIEEDGERDGPFCTTCYDVESHLVRMHDLRNGFFMCRNCETPVEHLEATGRGRGGGTTDPRLPNQFY